MISLKNYKQNLLALFICCALVPCLSNGASQQIQQSLHKACKLGDVPTAQHLINSGVNINALDENDGFYPLCKACSYGQQGIVKLLIDSGANVNVQNSYSLTPFHMVTLIYNNLEIAQLLVRNGAIVTKTIPTNSPNIKAYLKGICDAEDNFNPLTTPATLELLQRFIARNMHTAYVLKHFLTQPQDIQKELVKHALLHNQNILMQFYSCTNCDQLLTPNMLADNTYLQQKYADSRKKLPLRTNANWWNTKALPLANTTITFNK